MIKNQFWIPCETSLTSVRKKGAILMYVSPGESYKFQFVKVN